MFQIVISMLSIVDLVMSDRLLERMAGADSRLVSWPSL